jgi:hypothetical protein
MPTGAVDVTLAGHVTARGCTGGGGGDADVVPHAESAPASAAAAAHDTPDLVGKRLTGAPSY